MKYHDHPKPKAQVWPFPNSAQSQRGKCFKMSAASVKKLLTIKTNTIKQSETTVSYSNRPYCNYEKHTQQLQNFVKHCKTGYTTQGCTQVIWETGIQLYFMLK